MTIAAKDRQAVDVLTTALEGGYAEEWSVVEYARDPEDQSITWAKVRLDYQEHDEPGEIFLLTPSVVRTGFARFTAWVWEHDPAHRSYLGEQWAEVHDIEGGTDWGYLDAIGADAVLQFALLGEVIYS
jgi:hypothetical protein